MNLKIRLFIHCRWLERVTGPAAWSTVCLELWRSAALLKFHGVRHLAQRCSELKQWCRLGYFVRKLVSQMLVGSFTPYLLFKTLSDDWWKSLRLLVLFFLEPSQLIGAQSVPIIIEESGHLNVVCAYALSWMWFRRKRWKKYKVISKERTQVRGSCWFDMVLETRMHKDRCL